MLASDGGKSFDKEAEIRAESGNGLRSKWTATMP